MQIMDNGGFKSTSTATEITSSRKAGCCHGRLRRCLHSYHGDFQIHGLPKHERQDMPGDELRLLNTCLLNVPLKRHISVI